MIVNNNLHELFSDSDISFESGVAGSARRNRITCSNGQPVRVLAGNLYAIYYSVEAMIDNEQWVITTSNSDRPILAEDKTMEVTLPPLQSCYDISVEEQMSKDKSFRWLNINQKNDSYGDFEIIKILKTSGENDSPERITPPKVKVYNEKCGSLIASGSMRYG